LSDESALAKLLRGERRVWVIGLGGPMEQFQQDHDATLRPVARVGQWELFSNR
jgi:hypothetical protein